MYFLETVLFTTVHFNAIREIECLVIQSIAYSYKVATIILIILLSFYFRRVLPQMAKICKLQKQTNRRSTKAHL